MKVNFGTVLKNMDGKELVEKDKPITLAAVSVVSLLAILQNENPSTDEKLARYRLAHKIKDGGVVELTVEEVAIIKNMVGKAYNTMIVGQAFEMLETSVG